MGSLVANADAPKAEVMRMLVPGGTEATGRANLYSFALT
jgi:hypothetical protein